MILPPRPSPRPLQAWPFAAVIILLNRRSRKRVLLAWRDKTRGTLEAAVLVERLLPTSGGDTAPAPHWEAVRAQVTEAAGSLERAAADAPTSEARRTASSCADALPRRCLRWTPTAFCERGAARRQRVSWPPPTSPFGKARWPYMVRWKRLAHWSTLDSGQTGFSGRPDDPGGEPTRQRDAPKVPSSRRAKHANTEGGPVDEPGWRGSTCGCEVAKCGEPGLRPPSPPESSSIAYVTSCRLVSVTVARRRTNFLRTPGPVRSS